MLNSAKVELKNELISDRTNFYRVEPLYSFLILATSIILLKPYK